MRLWLTTEGVLEVPPRPARIAAAIARVIKSRALVSGDGIGGTSAQILADRFKEATVCSNEVR
jgi:hypothetical protein